MEWNIIGLRKSGFNEDQIDQIIKYVEEKEAAGELDQGIAVVKDGEEYRVVVKTVADAIAQIRPDMVLPQEVVDEILEDMKKEHGECECAICEKGRPMVEAQLLEHVNDNKDIFSISVHGTQERPPFTYSIGMYKNFGFPEIVIFGLPMEAAHSIISRVRDNAKDGIMYEMEKKCQGIATGYDAFFKVFPRERQHEIFKMACWYYDGAPFDTVILIWPDEENKFPWEPGFDSDLKDYQPFEKYL